MLKFKVCMNHGFKYNDIRNIGISPPLSGIYFWAIQFVTRMGLLDRIGVNPLCIHAFIHLCLLYLQKKYKIETEVENWIQKYDQDMGERQVCLYFLT